MPAPSEPRNRWVRRADVLWCIALTVLFETITAVLRFHLGLQSTRTTRPVGRLTFGLRVHHGYVGLVLLWLAPLLSRWPRLVRWAVRVGIALIVSDLVHHFLVLWPLTGDPSFDFVYPD
jgi:hypothetical protein